MDWSSVITFIVGSGGVIVLLAWVTNLWLAARNERRRTQPVVICHEHRPRSLATSSASGDSQVVVWLTNEGGGPAFNVRFGVEMRGVRFPFRGMESKGEPHRYRVVRPGSRMPEPAASGAGATFVPITLAGIETWGLVDGSGTPIDDGRLYWCRYENAYGQTWETVNPADPTDDLRIRRVRAPTWHARTERKRLAEAQRSGADLERRAVEELQAGMTPAGGDSDNS